MSNGNNPWGNNNNQKPPEFGDLVDKGLKRMSSFLNDGGGKGSGDGEEPEKKGSSGLLVILVIGFLIFIGFKSFYQIQPGERGVVLRFGQYLTTTYPGLNFKIPMVDQVYKIDVETVRKEEFGFRSQLADNFTRTSRTQNIESLMLTGDKNVININWVVQYRIEKPEDFLFNVRDVRAMVRDISESVIRRLVGNRDFDYVLDKREELALNTRTEMQDLLNKYSTGIKLVTVQLQDVNPPEPVRPSFNEVNEADQDKTRLVNEAQKVYNEKIPKARGQAKQMLEEAKGYAVQRVNNAEGDVARFKSIYNQYKDYKKVTRQRMYVETMKTVMPQIKEVVVVDGDSRNVLPLLNLNRAKEVK
jgi:membrane protease subunit HflK